MWTYSGNPKTSARDYVRFLIGDTVATNPLLQDEEIAAFLTEKGNQYTAAAKCCEALVAKFATQVDSKLGPTTTYASQRSEAYSKLAARLNKLAAASSMASSQSAAIETHEPIFEHNIMENK